MLLHSNNNQWRWPDVLLGCLPLHILQLKTAAREMDVCVSFLDLLPYDLDLIGDKHRLVDGGINV